MPVTQMFAVFLDEHVHASDESADPLAHPFNFRTHLIGVYDSRSEARKTLEQLGLAGHVAQLTPNRMLPPTPRKEGVMPEHLREKWHYVHRLQCLSDFG